MKKWMVTAVGKDKPGIVAALTQTFYQLGGNIEDTSMTRLADHFTVLIILHVPPELEQAQIEAPLKQVTESLDLQISLHPIDIHHEQVDTKGTPWTISVSGTDHLGIIYTITNYLSQKSINITHLSSKHLYNKSGQPLFLMALEAEVPDSINPNVLTRELHELAAKSQLEVHAEPLEVYTL